LSDMTAEQIVRCIDFRYISDAITPAEALEMLKKLEPSKAERISHLEAQGCTEILSICSCNLLPLPPTTPVVTSSH
jgi:hypothetical protein